jgi:hypothetical protein
MSGKSSSKQAECELTLLDYWINFTAFHVQQRIVGNPKKTGNVIVTSRSVHETIFAVEKQ